MDAERSIILDIKLSVRWTQKVPIDCLYCYLKLLLLYVLVCTLNTYTALSNLKTFVISSAVLLFFSTQGSRTIFVLTKIDLVEKGTWSQTDRVNV